MNSLGGVGPGQFPSPDGSRYAAFFDGAAPFCSGSERSDLGLCFSGSC